MSDVAKVNPSGVDLCTEDAMAKCLQTHTTLNDSIMAKLKALTVVQKKAFVEGMDKWVSSLKV